MKPAKTFIGSIGKVNMGPGDDTEVGYFIFTSKTTVGSCSKVTIWIDDKVAGYLTFDYTGTEVSCTTQPVEGKLLKIVAPVGNYKMTVSVENDCRKFITGTCYLKQGACRYYGLN